MKVCADATLVFPLLVAQTFATDAWEPREGAAAGGEAGCVCGAAQSH